MEFIAYNVQQATPQPARKRKRSKPPVRVACLHCRKRHISCSNTRPCERCVSRNLQCCDEEGVVEHNKAVPQRSVRSERTPTPPQQQHFHTNFDTSAATAPPQHEMRSHHKPATPQYLYPMESFTNVFNTQVDVRRDSHSSGDSTSSNGSGGDSDIPVFSTDHMELPTMLDTSTTTSNFEDFLSFLQNGPESPIISSVSSPSPADYAMVSPSFGNNNNNNTQLITATQKNNSDYEARDELVRLRMVVMLQQQSIEMLSKQASRIEKLLQPKVMFPTGNSLGFSSVIRSIGSPIAIWSKQHLRLTWANDAFVQLFSYDEESLRDIHIMRFIPGGVRSRCSQMLPQLIKRSEEIMSKYTDVDHIPCQGILMVDKKGEIIKIDSTYHVHTSKQSDEFWLEILNSFHTNTPEHLVDLDWGDKGSCPKLTQLPHNTCTESM